MDQIKKYFIEEVGLSIPEELSFGERCRCGHGYVPYWNGVQIYPHCGGCQIIIDEQKARREQRENECKMKVNTSRKEEEEKLRKDYEAARHSKNT